jgi:hypothetical protein
MPLSRPLSRRARHAILHPLKSLTNFRQNMRQKATAGISGQKSKPLIPLQLLENSATGSVGFQIRLY